MDNSCLIELNPPLVSSQFGLCLNVSTVVLRTVAFQIPDLPRTYTIQQATLFGLEGVAAGAGQGHVLPRAIP